MHCPCPQGLRSLAHRRSLKFYSHLAPWETPPSDIITISPMIDGVHRKDPPIQRHTRAQEELNKLRADVAFWTDGSFTPLGLESRAGSAAIEYKAAGTPLSQSNHSTTVLAQPAGPLCGSCAVPEYRALCLPAIWIQRQPDQYRNKKIFIGSDSSSTLIGMANPPFRVPRFNRLDFAHIYCDYLDLAKALQCTFHFQYVPSHVQLEPNEIVDRASKYHAAQFSGTAQEDAVTIELPTLKSYLLRFLTGQWKMEYNLERHERFHLVGLSPSRHLKNRNTVPRQLQCLYSQW